MPSATQAAKATQNKIIPMKRLAFSPNRKNFISLLLRRRQLHIVATSRYFRQRQRPSRSTPTPLPRRDVAILGGLLGNNWAERADFHKSQNDVSPDR